MITLTSLFLAFVASPIQEEGSTKAWIEKLGGRDGAHAVRRLAMIGERAVPALKEVLLKGSRHEKEMAVRACLKIVSPKTLELAIVAARDPDRGVQVLGSLCFDTVWEGLLAGIEHETDTRGQPDSRTIERVKQRQKELEKFSEYASLGHHLIRVLHEAEDPTFSVRRALVLDMLQEYGASDDPPTSEDPPNVVLCGTEPWSPARSAIDFIAKRDPALIRRLAADPLVRGRIHLFHALPDSTPGLTDLALQFSQEKNSSFRCAAIYTLVESKTETAKARLLQMALDPSARVRCAVLEAFKESVDPRVAACAKRLVNDPNKRVRELATALLGK